MNRGIRPNRRAVSSSLRGRVEVIHRRRATSGKSFIITCFCSGGKHTSRVGRRENPKPEFRMTKESSSELVPQPTAHSPRTTDQGPSRPATLVPRPHYFGSYNTPLSSSGRIHTFRNRAGLSWSCRKTGPTCVASCCFQISLRYGVVL
jgi:hypothetical protein